MLIKKLAVTNWVEKLDSGFSLAVITASWEISSSSSSEIEFMNSSNVLSFIGFTSLHYSALAGACNRSISHNKLKGDQAMLKKIKKKLKEPYFMGDLWCDYIRPAVMGLIGAAIGIAIGTFVGRLIFDIWKSREERRNRHGKEDNTESGG